MKTLKYVEYFPPHPNPLKERELLLPLGEGWDEGF